ncbi:MAG: hypothetical protein IJK68_03100 [Muribaculaceae bacterium]|nr:hypothetical protein [Muribaculaceae bacterium]MBR0023912.1 hypothetical protein [Muribaculaceae bacterium]
MKTLMRNMILLAAMVAAFGTSTAVAQTLRDASYNIVGKIAPNGTVRNSEYGAVGFFNNDGSIANAKNKKVGSVNGKMQIFDKDGSLIGYVNSDGSVFDGDSKLLGKIDIKSGKVANEDGETLGYANGIPIQRVAAYFFFDFFK